MRDELGIIDRIGLIVLAVILLVVGFLLGDGHYALDEQDQRIWMWGPKP